MYSPKRRKYNNMVNGTGKNEISDEESYPPTSLARDGISPYFMGKQRRKKIEKNSGNTSEPPPLNPFNSNDDEDEEIVIEEDDVNDDKPYRPKQKSIKSFIKQKNSDENRRDDFTSEPGKVVAKSIIPKSFDRRISDEILISSTANRKLKKFDFAADDKVSNIKTSLINILDPNGEQRKRDPNYMQKMEDTAVKGIETVVIEPKKVRKHQKNATSGISNVYPSFTTASGSDVHKQKFVNPIVDEERNSRSSIVECSRQKSSSSSANIPGLISKKSFPELTRKPSIHAPPFLKKAMGMETSGGGKDEQVDGLRGEPSLKNFDENIISLIESEIMSINTEIGWTDVAGLEGAKKALREIVVLPFKRPDVFTGIRAPPKGVLLFGPPGTGKTMIGRCVASQCRATFFNISASSLTSKWVGEGEKLVRALFAVARLKLPSVIFIDEVDSLLSARSESEHESSRRIKTEFLVQLDGVNTAPDERLLVLGATNRPQELDEAARRRFQKRLYIALPESTSRTQIVQNLLKDTRNEIDERSLKEIGENTDGYSGADMRQLCTEAAMGPIRDVGDEIETIDKDDIRPVNLRDFIEAARVVRPTVDDSQLDAYASWDKKFGCLLYNT